jgi:ERCC4-type nuclease
MFLIDDRAGSNKLIEKFDAGEATPTRLEAGDIAFFGNGPNDDVWYIGIEYKSVNDVVSCVKSGRFTGTQLPAMMELYDISFLLIEGISRPDPRTGQVVRYQGKQNSFSLGLPYKAYDNFLTSVMVFSALSGKPCFVKTSGNVGESIQIIRDIHAFFSKKWEDHVAMKRPDMTKVQNVTFDYSLLVEPEPGNPEYPKHVLRKSIFQVDRIGWEVAGKLADRFGTMESLMAAGQKELIGDKVGNVLAERIYQTLHGHPDPEVAARKRKKNERIVKKS